MARDITPSEKRKPTIRRELPAELRISVPSNVISSTVAEQVLSRLPIVRKSRAKFYSAHTFAPPTRLRRIVIDCTQIARASASGICDLLSLVGWIKQQAQLDGDTISIELEGHKALATLNIGLDGRPIQNPLAQPISDYFLPPVVIKMPRFAAATSEDGQAARRSFVRWADDAMASIQGRSRLGEIPVSALDAISTAMTEGLLNAYEHAYADEEQENMREVWIAISTRPFVAERQAGQTPAQKWVADSVSRGATKLIELSVVDTGVGIVGT